MIVPDLRVMSKVPDADSISELGRVMARELGITTVFGRRALTEMASEALLTRGPINPLTQQVGTTTVSVCAKRRNCSGGSVLFEARAKFERPGEEPVMRSVAAMMDRVF